MQEQAQTSLADSKFTGADASTRLAVDRTRLGYERTMMAWQRTSTSLISFGFTIQKFFQIENKGNPQYEGPLGPGNFGRLMILVGLVILVLATLEHRRDINALKRDYPYIVFPRSLARVVAAVIAVLGIVAMISVFIRS
jgi:putative membrane protein